MPAIPRARHLAPLALLSFAMLAAMAIAFFHEQVRSGKAAPEMAQWLYDLRPAAWDRIGKCETQPPPEDESARGRKSCGMCDMGPELCAQFGETALARSVGFSGSNLRLRRVLAKMRAGQPFTVGVVGGSVSRGHGLGRDSGHSENNMHAVVFRHLNETFPSTAGAYVGEDKPPPGQNWFHNDAQPATGSEYYSYCFQQHIPDKPDLILLELGEYQDENTAYRGVHEVLLHRNSKR